MNMLIRDTRDVVLTDLAQAELYDESDPDFDAEKFHKGSKDDIVSLLHSLICILEKNTIWLERDSDPKSNFHILEYS